MFDTARWRDQGIVAFNLKAVGLLGVLLVTVATLTGLCILVPLLRTRRTIDLTGAAPHLLLFAAIGFGFMLVEMSQVQRLTIFLGHPVYALSVVLFALLLSSGLGSLSTARAGDTVQAAMVRIGMTVAVLVAFGILTPVIVRPFTGASNLTRIAVSIAILLPLGFCMGMAFPLGMRVALRTSPRLAPWLWGINGAASVCASVLAIVIAITGGISAAFWAGTACYAAAFGALAWQQRVRQPAEQTAPPLRAQAS
jgi:predicted membrane-bound spermidine synthase